MIEVKFSGATMADLLRSVADFYVYNIEGAPAPFAAPVEAKPARTRKAKAVEAVEAVEAEPASEAIVDAVAVEVAAPGQTWEAFVERFSELLESRRLPLDASKQIADIVGVPTLVKIASDPAKLAAAYDALDAIATEPEAGA